MNLWRKVLLMWYRTIKISEKLTFIVLASVGKPFKTLDLATVIIYVIKKFTV